MEKGLILRFLKDQIGYTISIVTTVFLIILYFRLEVGNSVDIIYPIILFIYIYTMTVIIKFIHYYRFNKILEKALNHNFEHKRFFTSLEHTMIDVLQKLNKKNMDVIHQMEINNREHIEIMTQAIHQIKIPVTVIQLAIEDELLNNEGQHILFNKIKNENNKINTRLQQLLTYLRLDGFENDYLLESVNIKEALRKKINDKKDYFIYNKVYPKMLITQDYEVLTDKKWNDLLLDQLISNAIKYSAVKGVEQIVEFKLVYKKDKVELFIIDYGIGIPQYDLNRVFEPFFTGENGRKVMNASGIGLYICKKIANQLNHELCIESNQNQGTTVKITYLTKM